MTDTASMAITAWLERLHAGETGALERLVPLVYEELRQVARRQLARESHQNTLSATALVHEVYLRLLHQRRIDARDRDTFLAIAASTMWRVLVDHARRRQRLKRGGRDEPQSLDSEPAPALLAEHEVDEVLAVDRRLTRLGELDPRAARVVEYRIFAGLTLEPAGISRRRSSCSSRAAERPRTVQTTRVSEAEPSSSRFQPTKRSRW